MELRATEYSVDRGVATITLSRPHRNNAWTGRMHTEYRALLDRAEHDPAVRVVVVTGAGDVFCVGADSQALEGHVAKGGYDAGTGPDLVTPGQPTEATYDADFAYHLALRTPVIAAVNGPAAGVGLVLACYADLRFAASGVNLSTAHGKLGLPAEYGLSWVLPRLIGLTRANDVLLSSRKFTTDEAADWGLFNAVVPRSELGRVVEGYARDLAERVSPSSMAMTKRQIAADQHRDVGASVRDAGDLLHRAMREPDYQAGVQALVDRRPPEFPDPT